ncbi:MAG TPA: serine/threonine-protein kinase, partial [Bryobacteraceae bacterium]|nr:serine/threonine-protein kinase [Bryobacteraceae bacterium]
MRPDWRVCPACEARLDGNKGLPGNSKTWTSFKESLPRSAGSVEEGRFPAGTVLAGRYRMLGLLGQGGMGEVYRAWDLTLNQAVALKFLTRANTSEGALARFRNEVRIARQVSHPNVCRVYDIGMAEGVHFLSMEYLDGENLASLIRRIGRLQQDKSIEFARKICAGLAVAHELGVLHRDLKPANIMIDGRGHVRITDFGLAALADGVPPGDIASGTPAYMSPEQKEGKEVTVRSDIYSLGLTLHEMFTGQKRVGTTTTPTDLAKDLDPAVERVILRCLEVDPKRRPSSALNVAMALPGGDPIAAALAAGETPSPEMVAASSEKEGFSKQAAWLCFAGIVASIVLGFLPPASQALLLNRTPVDIPPEVLAFRSQDILKEFGYAQKPRSTAYGFDCCDGPNQRFVSEFPPAQRDAMMASHQPPLIRFWYRQSQTQLLPLSNGPVTYDSPPNSEPTMILMALDATGRLTELEARPTGDDAAHLDHQVAFDWATLFKEARLDPVRFKPSDPQRTPPMAFDQRMAWVGSYAEGRAEQIRVEAAAWQGRPVYLEISGDWRNTSESTGAQDSINSVLLPALLLFLEAGAAWVAWRNLRSGRVDRKGAARIAAAALLSGMSSLLLTMPQVEWGSEVAVLFRNTSETVFLTVLLWLAYVATEPYARRYWPDSLISWNRLLSGKLRDTLVASHVLAGLVLFCTGVPIINGASRMMSAPSTVVHGIESLTSTGSFASNLFGIGDRVLLKSVALLLLVILLRLLLRRIWIADFVAVLLMAPLGIAVDLSDPYRFATTVVLYVLWLLGILWTLRRFGLV